MSDHLTSDSSIPERPLLFRGILPLERSRIVPDLIAGVTLAAMNIPQALGYSRIAGMPVVTGLYTLLLPVIAFATFGSSRALVVAADSATAAILAGGLIQLAPRASDHYVALAGLVALVTACCLMIARLLRLGFLADFLSQTVLVGFLTGVGFQVGIAVLGGMLGLQIETQKTIEQFAQIIGSLSQVDWLTVFISTGVVSTILIFRKFTPRIPGPLLAVVGAVAASMVFDLSGRGVAIVGPISEGLPSIGISEATWREWLLVFPLALSCFVMIVAQSAATARAYALRHHQTLDENADLVGLSAANAVAAMSGTFVVNGSPTQTSMVELSGGRSQIAHLATAGVVAMVLLFLTGPLQYLPRCVLGAIVFTIAIGLVDVRSLRDILLESPGEFRLAIGTAVVVVLVGVEQGILLAMGLSLLRHVRHSYQPHTTVLVEYSPGKWRPTPAAAGVQSAPGLIVFQFGADLFYANATHFMEEVLSLLKNAPSPVKWLIVDAGAITSIDYSAAQILRTLLNDLAQHGIALVLVHMQTSLQTALHRHRLTDLIGTTHIYDTLHEALAAINHGHSGRVS